MRAGLGLVLWCAAGCAGKGLPPGDESAAIAEGDDAMGGAMSGENGSGGGGQNGGSAGGSNGGDELPPAGDDGDGSDAGFGPGPGGGTSGGSGTGTSGFMLPDFGDIGGFGGSDDAGVPALTDTAPKAPGDVLISELMVYPEGGPSHEWVELYTPAGSSFNLIGCILQNKYGEHVINKALYATPGLYLVMARDEAGSDGLAALYTYDGVGFSSSSDDVALICGDVTVDSVHYETELTERGYSMQLSASMLDATANDAASAWCLSTAKIGLSDNYGSPGVANSACP